MQLYYLNFFLLVIPKVVAFGLVDVEVESLDPPTLVVATFDPLLPNPITISKFLVGLTALGAPKVELMNFDLYT